MPAFLTLGIVQTKPDPKVDLIKKELGGATTIKRETPKEGQIVLAEPAIEVFGDAATDLGVGVNVGGGSGDGDGVGDAGVRDDGDEHVDDAHEFFF